MQKKSDKRIKIENASRGFTLVETLVAMLIFTTIVVFGISALVNMSRDFRTTEEIRQSLDTMSFVMEDISRNVRLGTTFTVPICSPQTFTTFQSVNSCPPATGGAQGSPTLAFQAYDNTPSYDHEIVYLIESGHLYKASDTSSNIGTNIDASNSHFAQITPDDVTVDGVRSGFSVSNNTPSNIVPIISLRLVGTVKYQSSIIPFNFQTAIAPRNKQ